MSNPLRTFCLLLALLLVPQTLFAASVDEILAMDEARQDDIVYWIHGVETAASKKAVATEEVDIGYDVFGRPVAEVVTACEADKKASLWEKIKAHF